MSTKANKISKISFCFVCLLALVAMALQGSLSAQGRGEERVLKRAFANYDKNKDGHVLREEFPGSDMQFKYMDKDKNKKVTYEEFKGSALARRLIGLRRRDMGEPRTRVSKNQLAARRLQNLSRFDKNKDGKVTAQEWTGTEDAFKSLDLDKNGVLDKKDRAAAQAYDIAYDEPEYKGIKSKLPKAEYLLRQWDKNKNEQLSRQEIPKGKIVARLFDRADTNNDKQLDKRELGRLVNGVNQYVNRRNRGYSRPRAWNVPFSAWDKDRDGRLDTKEWVEKKYLFKRMDINRDAHVTKEEVERYKRSVEGKGFIEKHDLNGDSRVTLEEFGGSPDAFRRADRNGDGVISSRDR